MPVLPLRRKAARSADKHLESALLRRSVGAAQDRRDRCAHCHRTPLCGELVHLYPGDSGETLVCELCRPLRRESPARSELRRSTRLAALWTPSRCM